MKIISKPTKEPQPAMAATPIDTLTTQENTVIKEYIGAISVGAQGRPCLRAFLHSVVITGKEL